jgi:hypothetical protein
MNYIFYSYCIALLLKGKLKAVQISIAAIVTFIFILLYKDRIIDFITGKSNSVTSLFALLFFIYNLMNIGYAAFNTYATLLVEIKEKAKNPSPQQQEEMNPEKNKNLSDSILPVKNYGSGIKTSPKVPEIRSGEPIKSIKVVNPKMIPQEISAPEVEINIESTQEFFEKEADQKVYSGVLNDNYAIDITDISDISEIIPEA